MKRFFQILHGLSGALFILCLATVITLNAGFLYDMDMKKYNIAETTGMTETDIRANFQAMVDYNNLGGPEELHFPTLPMSEGGRIHFEEVRHVFYLIQYGTIIFGAVFILGLILSEIKKLKEYRLWTGCFTIGLPLICGILAMSDWYGFFVTFHKLVFNNDYWIFDPAKDPVITILPDGYFLHCLVMIIAIALAAAAAFIIWYIIGRKNLRRRRLSN